MKTISSICARKYNNKANIILLSNLLSKLLHAFLPSPVTALTALQHIGNHSIADSSLFPTSLYLHSNSTQILALKKMVFLKKKKIPPPQKIFFYLFFNATFQCGRYGVFKKNFKIFFDPEKVKKQTSIVAHNWPIPFFPVLAWLPKNKNPVPPKAP